LILVAGISLSNMKPKVWDKNSQYFIPNLNAIMVSYSDFYKMPKLKNTAIEKGLNEALGIPAEISIYLDNGSFYFINKSDSNKKEYLDYEKFVLETKPDWFPIPRDYIPLPKMKYKEQKACFERTMFINTHYQENGYVPVIHIGRFLKKYITSINKNNAFSTKSNIAIGGIVPNLLRARKAIPYQQILDSLIDIRNKFSNHRIHIFGIGGTATIHLAHLLGIDSADSSGWRNRAARGIIQLPGSGDRVVAELGNWRGRRPSKEEWDIIEQCICPACKEYGIEGLKENGINGFCNRATHNLYTLINESDLISIKLSTGDYSKWFKKHIINSTYKPLIEYVVKKQFNPIGEGKKDGVIRGI